MKRIPIALIGAGSIGRSHVDRALKQPGVDLVGIAEPAEDGRRAPAHGDAGGKRGVAGVCSVDRRHQGEPQRGAVFGLLHQIELSAHLTDVSGGVSALSATRAGNVEVAARVENIAPVEIRGTLEPFARELALDLTAKATGIDLPPLTAYSGKYAEYGIIKGTLSFEVPYKIDNRKLSASNKLVLDQLTFGERVDSPTAP